jgi:hypothetical protein
MSSLRMGKSKRTGPASAYHLSSRARTNPSGGFLRAPLNSDMIGIEAVASVQAEDFRGNTARKLPKRSKSYVRCSTFCLFASSIILR